jgi:antagonist of KipI
MPRTLVVESPGMLTTVQDLGRWGYGPLGISPSGAADPVALRIANLLCGNPAGVAALEITLSGAAFRFPEGGVIALTGADCEARAGGHPAPLWTAWPIQPGGDLVIGAARSGARSYLAVRGGLAVPLVMGSASTHLLSGIGGWQGRRLAKGGILPVGAALGRLRRRTVRPEIIAALGQRESIRATSAPQTEWFSEEHRARFAANPYTVAEEANRMGLRLKGAELRCSDPDRMITEGVALGSVQVPPGGQLIILFVDHQTTGGYPKIASIISADMFRLGQIRPRDTIRFEWVSLETAQILLLEMEKMLNPEDLFR